MRLRRLALNGGRVSSEPHWHLTLPPIANGYADAQIDDYGIVTHRGFSRRHFPHRPGLVLSLEGRFSHSAARLRGTAGFGFWNAPFGDPTTRWPVLPQAAWFFFASEPNDLPFSLSGPGRGWFVATMDASRGKAMALIPLAPVILILNQFPYIRRRLWPWLRQKLRISYQPLQHAMDEWHTYRLIWSENECSFRVDDDLVLNTPFSPRGPLGFVCWIDNQYLIARPNGRLRWGTIKTNFHQSLEVDNLEISYTA